LNFAPGERPSNWQKKIRRGGGGQQGGTQLTASCTIRALTSAIAEGTNRLYLRTGLRRYETETQSTFSVNDLDRLEAMTLDPSS
jgi:hypothetical protein